MFRQIVLAEQGEHKMFLQDEGAADDMQTPADGGDDMTTETTEATPAEGEEAGM